MKEENRHTKYVQEPCKGCAFQDRCASNFLACKAMEVYTRLKPWKPEQRVHPSRAMFALVSPDHVRARKATKWNQEHSANARARFTEKPLAFPSIM